MKIRNADPPAFVMEQLSSQKRSQELSDANPFNFQRASESANNNDDLSPKESSMSDSNNHLERGNLERKIDDREESKSLLASPDAVEESKLQPALKESHSIIIPDLRQSNVLANRMQSA